jgi:nicotinate-nucleotide adenylyltransferase
VELAKRWGADVTDAARAGLLHDITKALDGPLQLTLCDEYDILLSKFSQENPKTLHALTGSLVADQVFGERPEVVEAIRYHTTGRPNMGLLEKILYIADYIEPCRNFPGVEELREAAFRDLDEAMLRGMEMTIAHVSRQGQQLAQATVDAVRFLREQGVNY